HITAVMRSTTSSTIFTGSVATATSNTGSKKPGVGTQRQGSTRRKHEAWPQERGQPDATGRKVCGQGDTGRGHRRGWRIGVRGDIDGGGGGRRCAGAQLRDAEARRCLR